MEKSYIMMSLEDDNAKQLADVMGNKTCKKILTLLAEKEMSESDIGKELRMPINTVEYNLKKLMSASLIEKSKDYFWSVKGKKIPVYKLSNKYIVISPKNSNLSGLKTILPVVALIGLGAMAINYISQKSIQPVLMSAEKVADSTVGLLSAAKPLTEEMVNVGASSGMLTWFLSTPWAVFLTGAVISLALYFIVKKIVRRLNK